MSRLFPLVTLQWLQLLKICSCFSRYYACETLGQEFCQVGMGVGRYYQNEEFFPLKFARDSNSKVSERCPSRIPRVVRTHPALLGSERRSRYPQAAPRKASDGVSGPVRSLLWNDMECQEVGSLITACDAFRGAKTLTPSLLQNRCVIRTRERAAILEHISIYRDKNMPLFLEVLRPKILVKFDIGCQRYNPIKQSVLPFTRKDSRQRFEA
ncbi:hypothetical protein F5146DRAFT_1124786 [Armillaria mellea]|nr:hypothetical protein F5146DRAFT_1124786 [Armillaria mellea]